MSWRHSTEHQNVNEILKKKSKQIKQLSVKTADNISIVQFQM